MGWTVSAIVGFVLVILAAMAGGPQYSIYASRASGEAELARANYSKQVAVQEANAKYEASKMLAQAEVERAKGVAQANKIIGDSLKDNQEYLRYLFVNNLENTKDQVIYVPTEANMPILEAGHRR